LDFIFWLKNNLSSRIPVKLSFDLGENQLKFTTDWNTIPAINIKKYKGSLLQFKSKFMVS